MEQDTNSETFANVPLMKNICCTVRDKLKQQGNRVSVQLTFYNAIDKMTY